MANSNDALKRRILEHFQELGVEKIFIKQVGDVFETALSKERIILSRPERERLFKEILWIILTNMIEDHT